MRKPDHATAREVGFRHLWGQHKCAELTATADAVPAALYTAVDPRLPLGLPFVPTAVSDDWFDWPALPELFPVSFPGVKTDRDAFLIDTDLDRLRARVAEYFEARTTHEELVRRYPASMRNTTSVRLDARTLRDGLLARGGPDAGGFVRCAYRPFDNRWLYWEPDAGLLARPRPDYRRSDGRPAGEDQRGRLSSHPHRIGSAGTRACPPARSGHAGARRDGRRPSSGDRPPLVCAAACRLFPSLL